MIPVKIDFSKVVLLSNLLPEDEIPPEFYRLGNKWNKLVSLWFFSGLPKNVKLHAKEGVDRNDAVKHCKVVLNSCDLEHNTKIAIVAFLVSQWFEDIEVSDV